MPFPKILSPNEIKEFDSPPIFNSHDRKVFFHLPAWANEFLGELGNDTNKLVFILMAGYFKCCRKFFVTGKFTDKDIDYVIEKFKINPDIKKLKSFSRMNFQRYKDTILKGSNTKAFDDPAKKLLYVEGRMLVPKKFKMKAIFQGLLDFLFLKRVEIPSYNAIAQIMTEVLNEYENSLQEKLSKLLDNSKKNLLNDLMLKIESETSKKTKLGKYKITKLKKFSHSIKPSKIKENIQSLRFFKNIFDNIQEVITAINLSAETIEYYATWSIKADSSQIIAKNDDKKYLHLISFVIYQYYNLQDLLIDILLAAIRNTGNTAKRENTDNYYQEKKERETKVFNMADSIETEIFPFMDKMEKILYLKHLSPFDKVEVLKKLLAHIQKNTPELQENAQDIKKDSKKSLNDHDLYDVFQNKSVKLQNRVSEIIKTIEFDRSSSSKKIMAAIDYYRIKNGKVDHNAPDSFIKDETKKEALYDDNDKFRVSLYKVFLFQEVAETIRAGRLNIKHSYRFKSIDEYLINKEFWRNNRQELLERAGLLKFQNVETIIEELKKLTEKQFKETNQNILNGTNKDISFKKDNTYILATPKTEKDDTPSVSDLFTGIDHIPLTEILGDVNNAVSFLESFDHHNLKHVPKRPNDNVFLAGITGYGCNIGIRTIAKISKGINENELSNTLNWYFNLDNIHSANNRVLSFVNQLDLPNIFRKSKGRNHTSSDGQKYALEVDSVTGNYSYKYFGKGKGVSVYSFIDERHLLFYSTVISSSEREAGYVIDGLMSNEVVKSDIHSTDTHGYSEIIFGITHFLGYSFAPRLKDFKEKSLYCFDSKTKKDFEKKGYRILPNGKNYINVKAIKENWEDVLRFIATIKLRETTASQLLKRLSSCSRKHRIYQALNEFGKIIRTIFMLKYIDDVKLRQAIEKQLNKVESANKFAKAVFFGNNQEFEYVTKEEQEIAESCKRLIENSIICWNYLYLSQKVTETVTATEKDNMLEVIKNGSIVVWKHINLLGEYDFSEKILNRKLKFDIPKILELNVG
jgi:TnpA family transposase